MNTNTEGYKPTNSNFLYLIAFSELGVLAYDILGGNVQLQHHLCGFALMVFATDCLTGRPLMREILALVMAINSMRKS